MSRIDRRNFFRSASGAALAVGAPRFAVPAAAGPAVTRRMPEIALAVDGASFTAGRIARRLAHLCQGSVILRIETTIANADAWIGSAHELVDRHVAFAFFAGLPRAPALSGRAYGRWMADEGGDYFDALASAHGIRSFISAREAPGGVWSKRPIDGADALSGRSVFTRGLARDVMRGLGANLAHEEAEADVVDCFASRRAPIRREGFRRVAIDGLTPTNNATAVTFTNAAWDRLPTLTQRLIAAAATDHLSRGGVVKEVCAAQPLPSAFTAAAHAVASAIVADIATRDAATRNIDRSYTKAVTLTSVF